MKQLLPLFFWGFILTGSLSAHGQPRPAWYNRLEIGLNTGPQFFLGDLGGNVGAGSTLLKDIDWEETKLSAGAYLNLPLFPWLSIRTALQLGAVAGNDIHSPTVSANDIFRNNRNLHFRSSTQELYLAAAFYPLQLIPFNKNSALNKLQPYALAGAGVFHFSPQAKDIDGAWVNLHPLRLEGQGFTEYPTSKPYSLTQFNLYGGVGIKYYISPTVYIGMELLYRKLFTDYVDDVSRYSYVDPSLFDTYLSAADAVRAKRLYYRGKYDLGGQLPFQVGLPRGNPELDDAFFSQTLHIGKTLFDQSDKRLRCPVSY